MGREILIEFQVKFDDCPLVFSQHIIKEELWTFIKAHLGEYFEIKINDYDNFPTTVFVTDENLKIAIIDNKDRIDAFKLLYGIRNTNYDILHLMLERIKNIQKYNGDDTDFKNDYTDYYIDQKKKTPEFSNLDDEKITNMVKATHKVLSEFSMKDNGGK